jgi:hypothetical protein
MPSRPVASAVPRGSPPDSSARDQRLPVSRCPQAAPSRRLCAPAAFAVRPVAPLGHRYVAGAAAQRTRVGLPSLAPRRPLGVGGRRPRVREDCGLPASSRAAPERRDQGGLPLPARNPGRDAREHADRRRAGGALRPRQLRPRTLVLVGACVEPRGGHGPWPPGALADVGGQGVGVDGAAAFHLGPREAAAVLIVQQAGAGVRLATPLVAGAERGEHSPGPLPQAMPVDTAPTASGSRVVRVPAGAVVAEDARRLAGGVCDQGFGLHELARARLAPAGTTACPQRFDCGRGPGNPTPPGLSASRTACPRRSVGSSGAGAGRRRAVCSAERAAATCP